MWISEQQLHCLVQSVYKLTLSIDVVHWLGPLSVRQVLGVSAVLLSWPIGWCSMSFFVWFFVGLFSTMILVLCTSSLNFIGCGVWGLGALYKKEIYHIFVNVIRVLWFLKMTHREVFFTYSRFPSFLLWFLYSLKGNQCFNRSMLLMVGEVLTLVFFQMFFLYRGKDTFRFLNGTFKGKWHACINSRVLEALCGWIIICLELKLLSTCISFFLKFRLL